MELEFSGQIFDKYLSNFMKFPPMGTEVYRAEGQTDGGTNMTKLIVTFYNFSNASIKYLSDLYTYHQYWVAEVNPIIFHEGMGRGEIEAYFYPSLISAMDGVGVRQALSALPTGTRHILHFTGDWTDIENLIHTGVRTPGRPAHTEPLYRLHYSGSLYWIVTFCKKNNFLYF